MDRQAIERMFEDGRVMNVKFATAGTVTAADLVEDLLRAERQIADGTAVRVDNIDAYSPSRSSL